MIDYDDMSPKMQAEFDKELESFDWKAEQERQKVEVQLNEVWEIWAHRTYGSVPLALNAIGEHGDGIYRPNFDNYKDYQELYGIKQSI